MQSAVDIANTSEHNKNKIASCLLSSSSSSGFPRGSANNQEDCPNESENDSICRVNHRPDILKSAFAPNVRLGKSSQFVHSETACIFEADFPTDGSSLFITDPPCPNCAKAICEAGITHVYIDHKGLDKDFAIRRGDDFQSLSLLMMEKAGIAMSILYRKDKKIEPLIEPPVYTRKGSARGIEFFDWNSALTLEDYLRKFRNRQAHSAWTIAKIREGDLDLGVIIFEELTQGLTPRDYAENRRISLKYRLPVDPLNRMLFFTKRKNIAIINDEIACNLHPSSRSLVNAVGYGIKTIHIGENKPDHDDLGHIAAEIIEKNGILKIHHLE